MFLTILLLLVLSPLMFVRSSSAQYMYLDTNSNGIHDAADLINQSGSTTIDVWLKTNANRDGTTQTCGDPAGTQKTMFSYSFILRAMGGTVAWSGFTNRVTGFTLPIGEYSDAEYYSNGRSTGDSTRSAGTYRLASVTVTLQTGTPYVVISPAVPGSPETITAFGSDCFGANFDNTLKLGIDWFDTDLAGPFDRWVQNGVPLVSGQSDQNEPVIVSDGAGGAIVVWEDKRAGASDKNIYAQRIDATGNPYWTADGVSICTDPATQETPRVVSDGAGGAIVAWRDLRTSSDGDIYAQRISASGAVLWTANGVAICTADYGQHFAYWGYARQAMISDGLGGAIIAWQDERAGGAFHGDIYAQKVNSSGSVQWTANGVAVCTAIVFQYMAVVVSDGSGGAIISWEDYRNDPAQCICVGSKDIYAQRVNSSGSPVWPTDGVPICVASGDQNAIAPIADGAGGAIFAWEDARVSASQRDIYGQRINGSGSVQWTANGVVVNAATGIQSMPSITTDAASGAIIAWQAVGNARVQRLDSNGAAKWDTTGIGLSTSGYAINPLIAADGSDGAVVVWEDGSPSQTLRAQHLSRVDGTTLWANGGVAIASVVSPHTQLVSDDVGGSIVAWEGTGGSDRDIFAMRVAPGGGVYATAVPESRGTRSHVSLGPAFPNPFNPTIAIRLELERAGRARVSIYDTSGRKVRTLLDRELESGVRTIRWDGMNEHGEKVASGIYYCRLEALGTKLTRTLALVR